MSHPDYIDTPRSGVENSQLATGLDRLDALSPEKSFVAPPKGKDLIAGLSNGRGAGIQTPRGGGRDPLRLLPNGRNHKAEFTPIMKSVTKKNHLRRISTNRPGVQTPSFLRPQAISNGDTPALPRIGQNSQIWEDKTGSSAEETANESQMPNIVSSSSPNTPLAALPYRDGRGGVVGDGNIMTLREQEKVIDTIEKDNFGLKLKIHFLEIALQQNGSQFNKAALQENTDLKVNRVTMQRELHRFKKNVAQAEKEAEVYRIQLSEYRDRIKKRQADESVRIEMDELRSGSQAKENQIVELEQKLQSASQDDQNAQNLRAEIGDLEADLRQKDLIIDQKDEEIDSLKDDAKKESGLSAEYQDELEIAKRQMDQLREDLDRATSDADLAKQDREDALEEKRQAEGDLEELQDEMANKSFTTPGLNRQLEEKTIKLEVQLEELQEKHAAVLHDFEEKRLSERSLQERLHAAEKESAKKDKVQSQLDQSLQDNERLQQERQAMAAELKDAVNELNHTAEEKDLLQSRHDALTKESDVLQQDLSKSQKTVGELENALQEERHHAARNDHDLRSQHKTEIEHLHEQIDEKHRELSANNSQHASRQDDWDSQRRALQSASQRAEEKANGLQRTLSKLQEIEGTLSGKEIKMQEALESEKQRHQQEEQMLTRQIKELNDSIATRREVSDDQRSKLDNAEEELRISIRDQAALKDKIQELDEEVELLQANLEEEAEYAEEQRKAEVQKVQKEQQSLRDQLANVNIELHRSKGAARDFQAERDDLEAKLLMAEKPVDNTFNFDQEKRELRRSKQRLEQELDTLRKERDSLANSRTALENDLNTEIDRAIVEEQRLQDENIQLKKKQQQQSGSDGRDRELSSAKTKITRLEKQVEDLQAVVGDQIHNMPVPDAEDVSLLRNDLAEARRKESTSLQREVTLKSTTRDLKSQITRLEREIHDLQLAKLASPNRSPSSSPSASKALSQTRAELLTAQSSLHELRARNKDLEAQVSSVNEAERADLHALLKSSTLEAEALSLKLTERDAKLRRLRGERERATAKSDAVERQLDALQERHERMLSRVPTPKRASSGRADGGEVVAEVREKEMRGLMKEVVWLRARCRREEGFRRDLAWSKGFMVMGEEIREACNITDLRMINDMGVRALRSRYETRLALRQRLRAAVYAVIAAGRMQRLEGQWRDVKVLGEGIRRKRGQ